MKSYVKKTISLIVIIKTVQLFNLINDITAIMYTTKVQKSECREIATHLKTIHKLKLIN
jgi:hypothetical protein